MFCVSMLISSYVLRRLTYFWCENRDERETFKGVLQRATAAILPTPMGGALPVPRPTAGPPARARIPGHRHAQIARLATPPRLIALWPPHLLAQSSEVLNTQLVDLPVRRGASPAPTRASFSTPFAALIAI